MAHAVGSRYEINSKATGSIGSADAYAEELEEEAKILEKILMLELNEREKIHFQSELEELQRSIEEEKKNQQMKKDAHQKAEEEKKLSAAEMLAQKRGLRIEPAEEIGPSLHAHLA